MYKLKVAQKGIKCKFLETVLLLFLIKVFLTIQMGYYSCSVSCILYLLLYLEAQQIYLLLTTLWNSIVWTYHISHVSF